MHSLADDKESTSSSRYSVTSAGYIGSVGKNATSVGDTKQEIGRFFLGCFVWCVPVGQISTDPTDYQTSQHVYGACSSIFCSNVPPSHHIRGGMRWCSTWWCPTVCIHLALHWLACWSPDLIILLLELRTWGEPHQLEVGQSCLPSGQVLGKPVGT